MPPDQQLRSLMAVAEQRGRVLLLGELVRALRRDPHVDMITLLDVLIEREPDPAAPSQLV
jgi:hypothetical protein